MKSPQLSTLDLTLLMLNILALGALLALMIFAGPSVPVVLLAIGAAAVSIGKLGRAFTKPKDAT